VGGRLVYPGGMRRTVTSRAHGALEYSYVSCIGFKASTAAVIHVERGILLALILFHTLVGFIREIIAQLVFGIDLNYKSLPVE
jgi:hypothetical protein